MVQILPQEPGLGELLGMGMGQGIQQNMQLQQALQLAKVKEAAKASEGMTPYQQEQTELRRREIEQRSKEFERKPIEEEKKREFGLIGDYAKKIIESESNIPTKQTALNTMKQALEEGNLGIGLDYLADLTKIEAFRSPEAAQFLTAGKEFFLGNLARVKAKGVNQWIERQLKEIQPLIGRRKDANLITTAMLQNEIELQRKEGDLFHEYKKLADDGKISYSHLPYLVRKELDSYATSQEKNLIKEIKRIKEIYGPKKEEYPGLKKLTPSDIEKFLKKAKNDPDKAVEMAKQAGYLVE